MGDGEKGCCLRLRLEHVEGVLGLTESIVDTAHVGIGMVATLVVEGVPLAAADELPLAVKHHAVGVGEREGSSKLCMLTPATGGTVDGVVGVPVVDILAPFASEDALVNVVVFAVGNVVGPVVEYVVVVLHALGVEVGRRRRTTRPGKLLAGNL